MKAARSKLPVDPTTSAKDLLVQAISTAGLKRLDPAAVEKFEAFLALIQQWNERMNLTAIRDTQEIVRRHFVECIACAEALPGRIQTLLDFGSGAGFPGIPIAICRPEICVTLAESQNKKAAFLQEVVRRLELTARVFPERAERLSQRFDCVTLRAVDRMEQAIKTAARLLAPMGNLAVLTTAQDSEMVEMAAGPEFSWTESIPLPGSDQRMLRIVRPRA